MSRDPDRDLLAAVAPAAQPGLIHSVDPTTWTAMVLLPGVDDLPHGPAPYLPAPGPGGTVLHPAPGARCSVHEDAADGMWISVWTRTP